MDHVQNKVDELRDAQEELKSIIQSSKSVLNAIKAKRKAVAHLKLEILNAMSEQKIDRVESGEMVIMVEGCSKVKHDTSALLRITGNSGKEYISEVTETKPKMKILSTKKQKRSHDDVIRIQYDDDDDDDGDDS